MNRLYLLGRSLTSPLEAIYTLLIFIVTKELAATPFQLSILACIKPTVSLVSAYTSGFLIGKPERIKPFLLLCNLIGLFPCLFFPYMENTWFFIASYAIFMIALRASYPAWIEVLKRQFTKQKLTNTVATGSSINYLILTLFSLVFTYFLDNEAAIWKYLFVAMAGLQLLNFLILSLSSFRLNLDSAVQDDKAPRTALKEALSVLRSNPEFVKYQILFFMGGAGLVAIQPILPIYFNETLHLSYTQLALAFSVCRGISFISSTPLWVALTHKTSLYSLYIYINLLSTLFIACLLTAGWGLEWLFVGYLMYGAMQAGCELSWNLSGPIFSKKRESISYSSLNLCFVSVRGMIFPFLGQLIYTWTNSNVLFSLSGIVCLASIFYAFVLDRKLGEGAYSVTNNH